jgi:adenylyltransferase/sulfurtransferase
MTPDELARYSRHIILPAIGTTGQQKLRDARVLIVGMGGLGSPASLYLAAAGIGTLGLAEFDTVEAHNLQRQILHDDDRVGTPKLESAMARLTAINPGVQLVPHSAGVTVENAAALFAEYDLIVDGTDNFPTRYLNNDAAFLARKPLVYGSVFQFEGQVSLFHPAAGGPCYRCLFPRMPEPGTVPNCEEAGVFGALCGVIGSYQAMEAIKFLAGVGESLMGRLLVIDSLAMTHRTLRLKRDPNCPLCGETPSITGLSAENYEWSCAPTELPDNAAPMSDSEIPTEISIEEAHARLTGTGERPFLLDVREPFEAEICSIEGAHLIPMQEVPERLEEVPKDREILVHCHHGGRSLRVTQFLRAHGYDQAQNIKGGIHEWATKFDPSMGTY